MVKQRIEFVAPESLAGRYGYQVTDETTGDVVGVELEDGTPVTETSYKVASDA